MKTRIFILIIIAGYFVFAVIAQAQTKKLNKKMSVTMDDLPFNRALSIPNEEMKDYVERLLDKIKSENVPVVAFVNENKLEVGGKRNPERVGILKLWLDAGVDLGNHTYSHPSANKIPVEDFKKDIIAGEKTIKELLAENGKSPKYFRHPFLHTGLSLEIKKEIDNFLGEHGYTIAPVTIDNAEWIFGAAYDKESKSSNKELMEKIGCEYIEYMKLKIRYFENETQKLFGRQISQILLIHSNRINSNYFSKLCNMIRGEGYDFISLEEALKDEAYKTPNTFIKNNGISWLDRWALTQGKKGDFFTGEPRTPKYIMDIAGVDSE